MHQSSDGLDNNDAQSFVDVHFALEGKTHANFDNSNDNFNDNFNNNHVDTVEYVEEFKPEFYGIVDEEMPGRGKFVSSPSLTRKSVDNEGTFVSEERKSLKRDSKNSIEGYYEKYSVQTAKILINTLFLPSQKICQYCAVANKSVVYSDRLVYENRSLEGRLVDCFCQFHTKQLIFKRKNLFGVDDRDFMPVFNVSKTNHSGLSYSLVEEPDVFDLNTLGPSILLVDTITDIDTAISDSDDKVGKIDHYLGSNYGNTDYYHRRMIDSCSRISRNSIFKPKVFESINLEVRSEEDKNTDCDDEIQYWMDFSEDTRLLSTKSNDEMFNLSAARLHNHNHNYNYSHNHRASLLMLEPILMMPDLPENGNKRRSNKKRITRSEHVKIVRIVIAYTLSFFLLAIVTFYIVYFV